MASLPDRFPSTWYVAEIRSANEEMVRIESHVDHPGQVPMRLDWYRQHVLAALGDYDEPAERRVPNEIHAWLLSSNKYITIVCTQ